LRLEKAVDSIASNPLSTRSTLLFHGLIPSRPTFFQVLFRDIITIDPF